MENKIYVIYKDSDEGPCYFKGYIFCTEDEAKAYIRDLNNGIGPGWGKPFYWNDDWYEMDELTCLNPEKLSAFLNHKSISSDTGA